MRAPKLLMTQIEMRLLKARLRGLLCSSKVAGVGGAPNREGAHLSGSERDVPILPEMGVQREPSRHWTRTVRSIVFL